MCLFCRLWSHPGGHGRSVSQCLAVTTARTRTRVCYMGCGDTTSVRILACWSLHTRTHMLMRITCTGTLMYTCTNMYKQSCVHTDVHSHTCIHTDTHSGRSTNTCTFTCTHMTLTHVPLWLVSGPDRHQRRGSPRGRVPGGDRVPGGRPRAQGETAAGVAARGGWGSCRAPWTLNRTLSLPEKTRLGPPFVLCARLFLALSNLGIFELNQGGFP